MRLIDADALFKEEREEYRNNAEYISTDYKHIFAEIDDMPTVCDIEQLRAEISDMFKHETQDDYWDGYESCRADALQIIDKYTGGMSDEVKEHYRKLAEHYDKRHV